MLCDKKNLDFLHKFALIFKINSADGVSIRELCALYSQKTMVAFSLWLISPERNVVIAVSIEKR